MSLSEDSLKIIAINYFWSWSQIKSKWTFEGNAALLPIIMFLKDSEYITCVTVFLFGQYCWESHMNFSALESTQG